MPVWLIDLRTHDHTSTCVIKSLLARRVAHVQSGDDWTFNGTNVVSKVKEYAAQGCKIVIFTYVKVSGLLVGRQECARGWVRVFALVCACACGCVCVCGCVIPGTHVSRLSVHPHDWASRYQCVAVPHLHHALKRDALLFCQYRA
jgi:hypothetical protein